MCALGIGFRQDDGKFFAAVTGRNIHSFTNRLLNEFGYLYQYDVALLVTVVDSETVKGSLRSRGRVDVGAIAVELGGGGHHNAAGFTLKGTYEDAVSSVRDRLA